MTYRFVRKFIKETHAAYFSFDETRIRATLAKYGITAPEDKKAFWGAVCKMIIQCKDAPADKVAVAKSWLRENGMSEDINFNV